MKTFTTAIKKALFICFVLATSFLFAQTTYIVNNNAGTSADFTDLQAAIDTAVDGDIIHVQQSSTSYGTINLNKSLTLIGRSHSDASYKTELSTINFAEGASNSIVKGFNITSGIFDAYLSSNIISDVVIQDCWIQQVSLGSSETYNNLLVQGNVFQSSVTIGANTSNVLIVNNIINASSLSFSMVDTLLFANNVFGYYLGIYISNSTPDLMNISNCIFTADYPSDLTVSLSSSQGTFQITNCLTYNYDATANYNFATDTNITVSNSQENIDPLFTNRDGTSGSIATSGTFNPSLDDLTLQAGSPFGDDGLYEGYIFKPLGTPTGLPSLKIDSYDPTVPKNSDLTVTITAKTN